MSTKTKTAPHKAPKVEDGVAKSQAILMTHAGVNAAAIIEKFSASAMGEPGIELIAAAVGSNIDKVQAGNMGGCEAMLMGQAMALQSMFMSLSRRAAAQDYLKQYETYLRLALKAQSQCRTTLETLAALKNPPVVFARQANIANGPQQVNNGVATPTGPRAEETHSAPNKLLETSHEQPMDIRPASAPGDDNSAVAAMVEIHRPA
ncbi:hypothetical protein BA190_20035 [Labrys sp. WJW]|uniref:hypothetical protein n=1 Tax=Labrys sp. WJW TaxID=1737983 RepID=UPI00082D5AA9|nr:hypothetical protein [Labrys sp. WJW]OCC03261.1 hypothetical protein BA190_20035 [Labrys sp. WJW]